MSSQKLSTDIFKFVIGGGINTAFTYCLYFCLQMVFAYQLAYALAFATGIVFSYWYNAVVVFKTPLTWGGFFAFPLVYLAQYLLSAGLLSVFVEQLGFLQSIALLAILPLTVPITFALSRWLLRQA